MNSEELDRFIRDMLADKNLPGLDEAGDEVRDQLVSDLKERLLNQVDHAIIDAVPEDRIDELNTLLDQPDVSDEKLQEFIKSTGVDIQQVTVDTMLAFRDLYVMSPEARET